MYLVSFCCLDKSRVCVSDVYRDHGNENQFAVDVTTNNRD